MYIVCCYCYCYCYRYCDCDCDCDCYCYYSRALSICRKETERSMYARLPK